LVVPEVRAVLCLGDAAGWPEQHSNNKRGGRGVKIGEKETKAPQIGIWKPETGAQKTELPFLA